MIGELSTVALAIGTVILSPISTLDVALAIGTATLSPISTLAVVIGTRF
jgi:hypothetical protein